MRNKNKNILIVILFILLSVSSVLTVFFFQEKKYLQTEINNNESLNDSIRNDLIERANKLIQFNDKALAEIDSLKRKGGSRSFTRVYGIKIGEKEVSLDEFIDIATGYLRENYRLKNELLKDSLTIDRYKKIIEQLKKDSVIKMLEKGGYSYHNQKEEENLYQKLSYKLKEITKKLENRSKELRAKDMLLNLIKKSYGIDTKIKYPSDSIKVWLLNCERLDSALLLFPYYKHKIKTNRKGETIIK